MTQKCELSWCRRNARVLQPPFNGDMGVVLRHYVFNNLAAKKKMMQTFSTLRRVRHVHFPFGEYIRTETASCDRQVMDSRGEEDEFSRILGVVGRLGIDAAKHGFDIPFPHKLLPDELRTLKEPHWVPYMQDKEDKDATRKSTSTLGKLFNDVKNALSKEDKRMVQRLKKAKKNTSLLFQGHEKYLKKAEAL